MYDSSRSIIMHAAMSVEIIFLALFRQLLN